MITVQTSSSEIRDKLNTLATHYEMSLDEYVERLLVKDYIRVYGSWDVGTKKVTSVTPLQSIAQTTEKTAMKEKTKEKATTTKQLAFDVDVDLVE
jgi:hypothetical protein